MIGPEVTVPDVTEAVIGYRQFSLVRHVQHNYQLVSPHTREAWPTAEMRAVCRVEIPVPEGIVLAHAPKRHSAPAKDCGCGIYAYFDACPVGPLPRDSYHYISYHQEPGTRVACLVSLSGRLEVHARGMRAERGRICAIGLNERLSNDELVALREIAHRFDAAITDERELEHLAPEYGSPLATSLRPYSPPPAPKASAAAPSCASELRVPIRRSRWEHAPAVVNALAGTGNGALMVLTGFRPLALASCGFSFALAAFFEAARRRRASRA